MLNFNKMGSLVNINDHFDLAWYLFCVKHISACCFRTSKLTPTKRKWNHVHNTINPATNTTRATLTDLTSPTVRGFTMAILLVKFNTATSISVVQQ